MLEDLKITRIRRTCKVGKFYESLNESDKLIFDSAIVGAGIGMRALAAELSARGFQVSETPLYAHRNKSCGCFRA